MTDILISAKPEKIEHKMEDVVGTDGYCWWTLARLPIQAELYNGGKVLFTNGKDVFAEGEIISRDDVEHHAIIFKPLKRVKYPQPKKAPTRGFTYVE